MRVVDDVLNVEGKKEFDLPIDNLADPLTIFRVRKFPDGHYRIYLEEVRTGRTRLILECYINEGKVVPYNFREGDTERRPDADQGTQIVPPPETPQLVGGHTSADRAAANGAQIDPPKEMTDAAVSAPQPLAKPDQSTVMGPAAAIMLPWRARLRRALQDSDRRISKTALRLRRR